MRVTWRGVAAGLVSTVLILAGLYARPTVRVSFQGPPDAEAQGVGMLSRSTCSTINSPVAGQTFCFEQSTNTLKFWTGAAWVMGTATETGVNNVADFGATGDGVTDDTTAILNAVNALNLGGSVCTTHPNRIVFFPPGKYRITSTITVPANVTLKGVGRFSINLGGSVADRQGSGIFKDFDGVAVRLTCQNTTTGSLWQMGGVEDMGFVGRGGTDTTTSRFIELGNAASVSTFNGAWEVFVRRNTFEESNGYAIYSAHSQTANIEQNWFNEVKFPIYYNTVVSTARIVRNQILDQNQIAGAIAMQFRPGTLGGSAGGPLIQGNYVLGFQYGVWNTSIKGMVIRDNVFEGVYHQPVRLDSFLSDNVTQDGPGPYGTVIDGNTFINWGAAAANEPAIQLSYAQNGYVGVNTFQSPNGAVTTAMVNWFDNGCNPQCTQNNIIIEPFCTGNNCGALPPTPQNSITTQNTFIGRTYIQQQALTSDIATLSAAAAVGRFWWNNATSAKQFRYFDGNAIVRLASATTTNQITVDSAVIATPTGTNKGTGTINVASASFANGLPAIVATAGVTNAYHLSVRGISATQTLTNNLRGTCTFAAASTCSVSFSSNEPDASYFVALGGNAAAAANVMPYGVTTKTVSGFTITATVSNSNSVDWILIH